MSQSYVLLVMNYISLLKHLYDTGIKYACHSARKTRAMDGIRLK